MKFVSSLTDADREALEHLHRNGPAHRPRQRAQAVLLSARGFTLEQLAELFQTHRDTVSGWLDAWQARGLAGLEDAPKPGRTSKIDALIETYLHEMLASPSPNMKAVVLEELKKKTSRSPGAVFGASCEKAAIHSAERGASHPKPRPKPIKPE